MKCCRMEVGGTATLPLGPQHSRTTGLEQGQGAPLPLTIEQLGAWALEPACQVQIPSFYSLAV